MSFVRSFMVERLCVLGGSFAATAAASAVDRSPLQGICNTCRAPKPAVRHAMARGARSRCRAAGPCRCHRALRWRVAVVLRAGEAG
ncbi:MAG: hypothetical protein ACK58T_40990, partial [Phycisphaerae bacterium]